jgi:acyl-CoA synthetase (AMP-forming)/AMP-acid ligase II
MTPTSPAGSDLVHSFGGAGFGPPWLHGGTILHHLAARAGSQPGEPFVTTVAAGQVTGTLTYGELDRHSSAMAGWLRREHGIGPGTTAGVLPLTDLDSIVTIFGLLRAGGAALLLSPADPVARLRTLARAAGAALVLRGPAVADSVYPDAASVPALTALPPAPTAQAQTAQAQTAHQVVAPSADALLFGTSGSTAASKLVVQSHYNAVANAAALRQHHDLKPGQRILGCLPLHHVNGLHFTLLGSLFAGAHVMLADSFDPFSYPQLIRDFRPGIASVVPSVLEALLETWRTPELPADFRYFVSAAAPLAPATGRRVWRELGTRVMQGYGLSETTNFATTVRPDISADAYRELVLDAEIPSVGVALPWNEVAILCPDGSRAPAGETGEICVRGLNVMSRYAGNPEATAQAFHGGWFHSQDLGSAVTDASSGRELFVIKGRIKNIAKIAGQTVSLDEMERVLLAMNGVKDAACVSLPHRFYGDQIVAAVVFSPGSRVDVLGELSTLFAAAVLPRRVVTLEAIPRTPTGKILRPQLAESLAEGGS